MKLLSSFAILLCLICSDGFAKHTVRYQKAKKPVQGSPYERFVPHVATFPFDVSNDNFKGDAVSEELLSEWVGFLHWEVDARFNSSIAEIDPYDFSPTEEGFKFNANPSAHILGKIVFLIPVAIDSDEESVLAIGVPVDSKCKLFLDPQDKQEEILLCQHKPELNDLEVHNHEWDGFFHFYRRKQNPITPNS